MTTFDDIDNLWNKILFSNNEAEDVIAVKELLSKSSEETIFRQLDKQGHNPPTSFYHSVLNKFHKSGEYTEEHRRELSAIIRDNWKLTRRVSANSPFSIRLEVAIRWYTRERSCLEQYIFQTKQSFDKSSSWNLKQLRIHNDSESVIPDKHVLFRIDSSKSSSDRRSGSVNTRRTQGKTGSVSGVLARSALQLGFAFLKRAWRYGDIEDQELCLDLLCDALEAFRELEPAGLFQNSLVKAQSSSGGTPDCSDNIWTEVVDRCYQFLLGVVKNQDSKHSIPEKARKVALCILLELGLQSGRLSLLLKQIIFLLQLRGASGSSTLRLNSAPLLPFLRQYEEMVKESVRDGGDDHQHTNPCETLLRFLQLPDNQDDLDIDLRQAAVLLLCYLSSLSLHKRPLVHTTDQSSQLFANLQSDRQSEHQIFVRYLHVNSNFAIGSSKEESAARFTEQVRSHDEEDSEETVNEKKSKMRLKQHRIRSSSSSSSSSSSTMEGSDQIHLPKCRRRSSYHSSKRRSKSLKNDHSDSCHREHRKLLKNSFEPHDIPTRKKEMKFGHIGSRKINKIVSAAQQVFLLNEAGEVFFIPVEKLASSNSSTYWQCLNESFENGSQKDSPPYTDNFIVTDIAANTRSCHILMVNNKGQIYSWGSGSYGKLGHGSTENVKEPTLIQSLVQRNISVASVCCGPQHSLAITSTGEVLSWGFNGCGQLGLGDRSERRKPEFVKLPCRSRVVQVAASQHSSICLLESGEVYTWGSCSAHNCSWLPFEAFCVRGIKMCQVAAANGMFAALSLQGEVYSWSCFCAECLHADQKTPVIVATKTVSISATESSLFYLDQSGQVKNYVKSSSAHSDQKESSTMSSLNKESPLGFLCLGKDNLVVFWRVKPQMKEPLISPFQVEVSVEVIKLLSELFTSTLANQPISEATDFGGLASCASGSNSSSANADSAPVGGLSGGDPCNHLNGVNLPLSEERECITVAALHLLATQLLVAAKNSLKLPDEVILPLKQQLVMLACGSVVGHSSIQKASQLCLVWGWSLLLPTAEEHLLDLYSMLATECTVTADTTGEPGESVAAPTSAVYPDLLNGAAASHHQTGLSLGSNGARYAFMINLLLASLNQEADILHLLENTQRKQGEEQCGKNCGDREKFHIESFLSRLLSEVFGQMRHCLRHYRTGDNSFNCDPNSDQFESSSGQDSQHYTGKVVELLTNFHKLLISKLAHSIIYSKHEDFSYQLSMLAEYCSRLAVESQSTLELAWSLLVQTNQSPSVIINVLQTSCLTHLLTNFLLSLYWLFRINIENSFNLSQSDELPPCLELLYKDLTRPFEKLLVWLDKINHLCFNVVQMDRENASLPGWIENIYSRYLEYEGRKWPVIRSRDLHNQAKAGNFWVVVHGKVYDLCKITSIGSSSLKELLKFRGTDATEQFDQLLDNKECWKELLNCCIGEYQSEDEPAQCEVEPCLYDLECLLAHTIAMPMAHVMLPDCSTPTHIHKYLPAVLRKRGLRVPTARLDEKERDEVEASRDIGKLSGLALEEAFLAQLTGSESPSKDSLLSNVLSLVEKELQRLGLYLSVERNSEHPLEVTTRLTLAVLLHQNDLLWQVIQLNDGCSTQESIHKDNKLTDSSLEKICRALAAIKREIIKRHQQSQKSYKDICSPIIDRCKFLLDAVEPQQYQFLKDVKLIGGVSDQHCAQLSSPIRSESQSSNRSSISSIDSIGRAAPSEDKTATTATNSQGTTASSELRNIDPATGQKYSSPNNRWKWCFERIMKESRHVEQKTDESDSPTNPAGSVRSAAKKSKWCLIFDVLVNPTLRNKWFTRLRGTVNNSILDGISQFLLVKDSIKIDDFRTCAQVERQQSDLRSHLVDRLLVLLKEPTLLHTVRCCLLSFLSPSSSSLVHSRLIPSPGRNRKHITIIDDAKPSSYDSHNKATQQSENHSNLEDKSPARMMKEASFVNPFKIFSSARSVKVDTQGPAGSLEAGLEPCLVRLLNWSVKFISHSVLTNEIPLKMSDSLPFERMHGDNVSYLKSITNDKIVIPAGHLPTARVQFYLLHLIVMALDSPYLDQVLQLGVLGVVQSLLKQTGFDSIDLLPHSIIRKSEPITALYSVVEELDVLKSKELSPDSKILSGSESAKQMTVNTYVVRGKDWKWGDQDGPPPRLGRIVSAVCSDGWVRVHWLHGSTNSYRMGREGMYDLQLADPELVALYADKAKIDSKSECHTDANRATIDNQSGDDEKGENDNHKWQLPYGSWRNGSCRDPSAILRHSSLQVFRVAYLSAAKRQDILSNNSWRRLASLLVKILRHSGHVIRDDMAILTLPNKTSLDEFYYQQFKIWANPEFILRLLKDDGVAKAMTNSCWINELLNHMEYFWIIPDSPVLIEDMKSGDTNSRNITSLHECHKRFTLTGEEFKEKIFQIRLLNQLLAYSTPNPTICERLWNLLQTIIKNHYNTMFLTKDGSHMRDKPSVCLTAPPTSALLEEVTLLIRRLCWECDWWKQVMLPHLTKRLAVILDSLEPISRIHVEKVSFDDTFLSNWSEILTFCGVIGGFEDRPYPGSLVCLESDSNKEKSRSDCNNMGIVEQIRSRTNSNRHNLLVQPLPSSFMKGKKKHTIQDLKSKPLATPIKCAITDVIPAPLFEFPFENLVNLSSNNIHLWSKFLVCCLGASLLDTKDKKTGKSPTSNKEGDPHDDAVSLDLVIRSYQLRVAFVFCARVPSLLDVILASADNGESVAIEDLQPQADSHEQKQPEECKRIRTISAAEAVTSQQEDCEEGLIPLADADDQSEEMLSNALNSETVETLQVKKTTPKTLLNYLLKLSVQPLPLRPEFTQSEVLRTCRFLEEYLSMSAMHQLPPEPLSSEDNSSSEETTSADVEKPPSKDLLPERRVVGATAASNATRNNSISRALLATGETFTDSDSDTNPLFPTNSDRRRASDRFSLKPSHSSTRLSSHVDSSLPINPILERIMEMGFSRSRVLWAASQVGVSPFSSTHFSPELIVARLLESSGTEQPGGSDDQDSADDDDRWMFRALSIRTHDHGEANESNDNRFDSITDSLRNNRRRTEVTSDSEEGIASSEDGSENILEEDYDPLDPDDEDEDSDKGSDSNESDMSLATTITQGNGYSCSSDENMDTDFVTTAAQSSGDLAFAPGDLVICTKPHNTIKESDVGFVQYCMPGGLSQTVVVLWSDSNSSLPIASTHIKTLQIGVRVPYRDPVTISKHTKLRTKRRSNKKQRNRRIKRRHVDGRRNENQTENIVDTMRVGDRVKILSDLDSRPKLGWGSVTPVSEGIVRRIIPAENVGNLSKEDTVVVSNTPDSPVEEVLLGATSSPQIVSESVEEEEDDYEEKFDLVIIDFPEQKGWVGMANEVKALPAQDDAITFCDSCLMKPIVGPLYCCTRCPDLEYCSQCYERKGHKHPHSFKAYQRPSSKSRADPGRMASDDNVRSSERIVLRGWPAILSLEVSNGRKEAEKIFRSSSAGRFNHCWQSTGGIHWMKIKLKKKVVINKLAIQVRRDDALLIPDRVFVRGGDSFKYTSNLNSVDINSSVQRQSNSRDGGQIVTVSLLDNAKKPLQCLLLNFVGQMNNLQEQQKDIRIWGIDLEAFVTKSKPNSAKRKISVKTKNKDSAIKSSKKSFKLSSKGSAESTYPLFVSDLEEGTNSPLQAKRNSQILDAWGDQQTSSSRLATSRSTETSSSVSRVTVEQWRQERCCLLAVDSESDQSDVEETSTQRTVVPPESSCVSRNSELDQTITLDGSLMEESAPETSLDFPNIPERIDPEPLLQSLPPGSTRVFVWGLNDKDQLGGPKGSKVKTPVLNTRLSSLNCVQITGGSKSLFCVTQEGRVYACGDSSNGRLGLGNITKNVSVPTLISGLSQYIVEKVAVHSGGRHAMALTIDGRLLSWGEGDDGKLGHNSRLNVFKPRVIEALRGRRIVDMACGSSHSAAITAAGELFTWGLGEYGRLGHGDFATVLKPKQVRGALSSFRVVQVSCGSRDAQTLALTDDGTVWSWGDGDFGKLGRGGSEGCSIPCIVDRLTGQGVIQIECGAQFSLALNNKGEIYTWGKGDYYRLGHGNDGHVRKPQFVDAVKGKKIVHVAVGALHCLAVTNDGKVYAWGDNDHGQQGIGNTEVNRVPQLVQGLDSHRIVRVACGSSHSVAWTAGVGSRVVSGTNSLLPRSQQRLASYIDGSFPPYSGSTNFNPVLFMKSQDPLGVSYHEYQNQIWSKKSSTENLQNQNTNAWKVSDSKRPSLVKFLTDMRGLRAKREAGRQIVKSLQINTARLAISRLIIELSNVQKSELQNAFNNTVIEVEPDEAVSSVPNVSDIESKSDSQASLIREYPRFISQHGKKETDSQSMLDTQSVDTQQTNAEQEVVDNPSTSQPKSSRPASQRSTIVSLPPIQKLCNSLLTKSGLLRCLDLIKLCHSARVPLPTNFGEHSIESLTIKTHKCLASQLTRSVLLILLNNRTSSPFQGSAQPDILHVLLSACILELCSSASKTPVLSEAYSFFDSSNCFSPSSKSVVQESPHPYPDNARLKGSVNIPGAEMLRVEFDRQCATEPMHDQLTLLDGSGKVVEVISGRDRHDWNMDLMVTGSELHWKFISDNSVNDWGWRFTVHPVIKMSSVSSHTQTDTNIIVSPNIKFVQDFLDLDIEKYGDSILAARLARALAITANLISFSSSHTASNASSQLQANDSGTAEQMWALNRLRHILHNPQFDLIGQTIQLVQRNSGNSMSSLSGSEATRATHIVSGSRAGSESCHEPTELDATGAPLGGQNKDNTNVVGKEDLSRDARMLTETSLTALIRALPTVLQRQYSYEDQPVRSGKQLMHSPFLRTLCILACDIHLDELMVICDSSNWLWFRRFCTAWRTSKALLKRQPIPSAFLMELREKFADMYEMVENKESREMGAAAGGISFGLSSTLNDRNNATVSEENRSSRAIKAEWVHPDHGAHSSSDDSTILLPNVQDAVPDYADSRIFGFEEDIEIITWLKIKPDDWKLCWPGGSGHIWGWGHNHRGQLGGVDGSKVKVPVPCDHLSALRPIQIIGGEQSLFIVTVDGRVYATGYGANGRLGIGGTDSIQTPMMLDLLQPVNIIKVSVNSGGKHCLALSSKGQVYSWGEGEDGKLGHGTRVGYDKPKLIESLTSTEIIDIAAGGSHSAAVSSQGELYTWGKGRYGRLGHGDTDEQLKPKLIESLRGYRVSCVACGGGDAQTLCITNDDSVWSWGDGDYGKLGRGGSEVCKIPMKIDTLQGLGVIKVECGSQFSMALTRSGAVYTWGKGDYHRLGHGQDEHVRVPKRVMGLTSKHIIDIACGSLHCIACTDTGEVYSWGDNDEGQLGDGTTNAINKPRTVTALQGKRINRVACGSAHTIAWCSPKPGIPGMAPTSGANKWLEALPTGPVPLELVKIKDYSLLTLRNRFLLLHHFSELFTSQLSIMSMDDPLLKNYIRKILLPTSKETAFRIALQTTMHRDRQHGPEIRVNRLQASAGTPAGQLLVGELQTDPRGTAQTSNTQDSFGARIRNDLGMNQKLNSANHHDPDKSVFAQICSSLLDMPSNPSMETLSELSVPPADHFFLPHRVWKVKLIGESVDDCGGGYSESIAEMCDELQNGILPILIPGPTGDSFVLKPEISRRDWLFFLGVLMGIAIRTGHPLSLYLSEIIWKILSGQDLTLSDVGNLHEQLLSNMLSIRDMPESDLIASELPLVFQTVSGKEIRLNSFMSSQPSNFITPENRDEYLKACVHYRLHEFDNAAKIVIRGMAQVVPVPYLSLFTGVELESMVCGNPEIPVMFLRSIATYKGVEASDSLMQWFWEIMEEMSNRERSLFLRFVWGRARLPRNIADMRGRDFVIQVLEKYVPPDHFLPEAYTCFFLLKMPRYSCKPVLREKLLYAIHFCKSIDIDDYARIALSEDFLLNDSSASNLRNTANSAAENSRPPTSTSSQAATLCNSISINTGQIPIPVSDFPAASIPIPLSRESGIADLIDREINSTESWLQNLHRLNRPIISDYSRRSSISSNNSSDYNGMRVVDSPGAGQVLNDDFWRVIDSDEIIASTDDELTYRAM